VSSDTITFSLTDKEGASTGMPGTVNANVTYSVANGTWSTRMVATADAKTRMPTPQATYLNPHRSLRGELPLTPARVTN